jgi:flagellar secretion chaperone FliS
MWKEAYLANVVSADPMELVCLLYQHGLGAVQEARRHLKSGDIAARGKAICKAVAIIGELTSSLDLNAGGTISANLEQLYEYMSLRLTEANIRKQDELLAEVEGLLNTLNEAWREAKAKQPAAAEPPAAPKPAVWQETNLEPATQGWSA